MANLGFVGLGVMGGHMVERLLDKGHAVTGYNRTRSRAQWLIDRGMTWADSPRAVSSSCDIVLSMIANSDALSEIAEALIERGKSPTVGEQFDVPALNRSVRIVRHRTDQSYGILLHQREIEWDEPGANAGSSPLRRNLEDR